MSAVTISETFDNERLDPLLSWFNPPAKWRIDPSRSRLLIEPDAPTDFWQRTLYGFRASNGHLLKAEIPGNAIISAQIESHPVHQYDQAGLMIWFSEECWLKTSVEFEYDGPSRLGAVATNAGFSDWSMQDFVPQGETLSYCLRIRRVNGDFFVEYRPTQSGPWKLIRLVHLSSNPAAQCFAGVYACSPKNDGFRAEIDSLTIDTQP